MMWQRVDGALIGWDEERPLRDFTDYLDRHRILTVVDGAPGEIIALRFLIDDEERVAIARDAALASGIDLADLVADIAAAFDVEVEAGEYTTHDEDDDHEEHTPEPDDGHVAHGCDGESCTCNQGDGIRAVTILDGGVAEVAAVARSLGEPIVVLPLVGRSALLTEEGDSLPALGDTASVQVLGREGRTAMVYESEELTASVSWGIARELTPRDVSDEVAGLLAVLSHDDDLVDAVTALGGARDGVAAALDPVGGGAQQLMAALDIPNQVREFFAGERAAHEVDDVVVITPPTAGETLSYLVDDVLQEAPFADRLEEFERDHPVATRAPSASAIVIGSALVAVGLTRTKGLPKALLVGVGGTIMANGIAGLSLTELLRSTRTHRAAPNW